MAVKHMSGVANALYHTFVLPTLSHSTIGSKRAATNPSIWNRVSHRTLSSTASLSVKQVSKQARAPEVRKEKWNEEIAKIVYLIDPETGTLTPEPRTRYDLLRRINLNTHRIVQFGTEHEGVPVCKIVSKQEEYQKARRLKEASKERKKMQGFLQSTKTLELNWAMDVNDLGHRMDKIVEFLAEGRKVEVILASKKRGRKATQEECEDVLRKIRLAVEGVEGARETKQMEGKIGGFATLLFQGRQGQQQVSQAAG